MTTARSSSPPTSRSAPGQKNPYFLWPGPAARTRPTCRRPPMRLTDRREPDLSPEVLLAALADARRRKEQASRDTRVLLAYAREIAAPRPYRLADLARVTGLSISGIRTAYNATDVDHAAR